VLTRESWNAAELGCSGRGSRAHSQVSVHCGISILATRVENLGAIAEAKS
jgi:hypothetical protein